MEERFRRRKGLRRGEGKVDVMEKWVERRAERCAWVSGEGEVRLNVGRGRRGGLGG